MSDPKEVVLCDDHVHDCPYLLRQVRALEAEVERLRAGRGGDGDSCPICSTKQARISAALAECESTEKCDVACNLPSRVVQALRGEPAQEEVGPDAARVETLEARIKDFESNYLSPADAANYAEEAKFLRDEIRRLRARGDRLEGEPAQGDDVGPGGW